MTPASPPTLKSWLHHCTPTLAVSGSPDLGPTPHPRQPVWPRSPCLEMDENYLKSSDRVHFQPPESSVTSTPETHPAGLGRASLSAVLGQQQQRWPGRMHHSQVAEVATQDAQAEDPRPPSGLPARPAAGGGAAAPVQRRAVPS